MQNIHVPQVFIQLYDSDGVPYARYRSLYICLCVCEPKYRLCVQTSDAELLWSYQWSVTVVWYQHDQHHTQCVKVDGRPTLCAGLPMYASMHQVCFALYICLQYSISYIFWTLTIYLKKCDNRPIFEWLFSSSTFFTFCYILLDWLFDYFPSSTKRDGKIHRQIFDEWPLTSDLFDGKTSTTATRMGLL